MDWTIFWIVLAVIYVIGIPFCYFRYDWGDTKFEKIWLCIFWPLVAVLRIIHWLRGGK